MSLSKEEKTKVIVDSRRNEKDTGSTEVQVAILTRKINKLTIHMAANKHDFSSKRGMDILIARRTNLLSYLKRTDPKAYEELVKKLKAAK
jgi:small subunit ribosomal protein S15